MRQNEYSEPWRFTQAGDELVGKIQAHDTLYGVTKVSADGESLQELDIPSLVNTDIEEKIQ